jgi:hypothetical protein
LHVPPTRITCGQDSKTVQAVVFTSTKRFDSPPLTWKVRNSLSFFYQHPLLCDSSFHLFSVLEHPQASPKNFAMDDVSDSSSSGDTTSADPTTSPACHREDAAQDTMSADSLPPIKDSEVRIPFCFANYITNRVQNKTSGEIAAILQQWYEVEDRYDQTKPEGDKQYFSKCARLFGEYSRHQIQHAVRVASLPSTIDYSQLSTAQLDILTQAMSYDQKAGMANWALYKAQKKAIECCNAFEEMATFCLEHFILCEAQEQDLREKIISPASSRRYLREMGPRVVTTREHIINLVKARR